MNLAMEDEDMQNICNLLVITLQATRSAANVVSIVYDNDSEIVTVTFKNGGHRKVNVAMDSGTAMIWDIMRNLGCQKEGDKIEL